MNLAEVIEELTEKHVEHFALIVIPAKEMIAVRIQTIIVETAKAMRKACELDYIDARIMEMDGNAEIKGEEYTQGYDDAVHDIRERMAKFIFSYEEKKEKEDVNRKDEDNNGNKTLCSS